MTREQWARLSPEQRARFQAQFGARQAAPTPADRAVDRRHMPRWLAFVVVAAGALVIAGGSALLVVGVAKPVLSFARSTDQQSIHGSATSFPYGPAAPGLPASGIGAPAETTTTTADPGRKAAAPVNRCAHNTANQQVIVSLKAQHAWYCAGTKAVFETAVTSGMATAGTRTPKGHFTIQAKVRDTVLTPSTGEAYAVKYWIPFQGAEYGFHDASWQTVAFGSTGYRSGGSHGCVHLPLKAVKYLYSWVRVGASVTIA